MDCWPHVFGKAKKAIAVCFKETSESVDLKLAAKQVFRKHFEISCTLHVVEHCVASSASASVAMKFRVEDLNIISTRFLAEVTWLMACFIKSWIPRSLNSYDDLGFEVVLVVLLGFLIKLTSMNTNFCPSSAPPTKHALPAVLNGFMFFQEALVFFFSQHLEKIRHQWGLGLRKRLCLLLQGLKMLWCTLWGCSRCGLWVVQHCTQFTWQF